MQTEAPEGAPGALFGSVEKEINIDLSESDKAVIGSLTKAEARLDRLEGSLELSSG